MASNKKQFRALVERCRVRPDRRVRLKRFPTKWDKLGDRSHKIERRLLGENVTRLAEAQERLYAADSWAVLLVFQAMDAAGKDSTIKHVMSGVNPQGCQVTSFKHPSAEDLDHDFLWRCSKALPERGRIGIFNRSYYEEVLILKVHPELLVAERIPRAKPEKSLWKKRYDDINAFERHLARNGTLILKFFLHVSKEEQKRRFLARIEDPKKQWKFSVGDLAERALWDQYMDAYEDCLSRTSTEHAPWFVVPADDKPLMRSLVATIVTDSIRRLGVKYPEVTKEQRKQIAKAKSQLNREKG